MSDKAINQLRKIIRMEGISRTDGSIARELAFNEWLDAYTSTVELNQPIIRKALSSEDEDFIKYHLATKMSDALMEDCIHIETTNSSILTKVRAFKR